MTAIGYASVLVGSLTGLVGAMMAIGGSFMPADGAAAGGPGGRFLMFAGLGIAAVSVLLVTSGVGILRMAPWGRSLGVAQAALGVLVYGAAVLGDGLDPLYLAALAWSLFLLALLSSPGWKAALA